MGAVCVRWSSRKGLRVSALRFPQQKCKRRRSTNSPAVSFQQEEENHTLHSSEASRRSGSPHSNQDLLEDPASLAALLRLHGKNKSLLSGKLLHAFIISSSYEHNTLLANCLIGMYSACGSLPDAQSTFNFLFSPNVFSWNLLLHAYGQHASLVAARALFEKIPHPDVCSWNTLIKLVSQHGCLDDTINVFARMPHRNIVSWNAMISASARPIKRCQDALFYFSQMQLEGIFPDKFTFVSVIDACTALRSLDMGKIIHLFIMSIGLEQDSMVGTALIFMYDKCGITSDATSVFERMPCADAIAWTAMIAAFSHNEQGTEALNLFYSMLQKGMKPDKITYVCALDACASLSTLQEGKEIHSAVVQLGLDKNPVIGTALVKMYGRGASLCDASSIFNKLYCHDAIPWTVMIGALTENQEHERALCLFYQMHSKGFTPDEITFICVLEACAGLASLEVGHAIYGVILDKALEQDVIVGNNLVNMYGKCGCVLDSRKVFDKMSSRNILTWNIMLGACALNGHYMEAIQIFDMMTKERREMDEITYLCILTACSHGGLVEFGRYIFASIDLCHGVNYTREHYVCAIDLLGRAGHLEEAEVLIQTTPFANFAIIWLCLLGACKTHGDVERGARAAEWCFNLDPADAAPCIALLNIYSEAGKWEDVESDELNQSKIDGDVAQILI